MTELSPQQLLSEYIRAYKRSQAVYVAARLELADRLYEQPQTAQELAVTVGAHADSLYRLLRALASIGIFHEDGDHRFHMTPMAEILRRDTPDSQHVMALMMCEEHYSAFGELLYSITTGKPAFEKVYGMSIFEYLGQHPEKGQIFDQAMTAIHIQETAALLDGYDFSGASRLVDVGGGNGSLLQAILGQWPHMEGILFDLPPVIERAKADLESQQSANRLSFVQGDFFSEVPAGGDTYMLRHIIHDWDDDKAGIILKNIHRAMPDDGRLLILESVVQPSNEDAATKFRDLTMLVIPGGRERSESEYRRLLRNAGFELGQIVYTTADISVIEADKRDR